MSNNTKFPAFKIILTIATLLFISAFFWNKFQQNNSEQITVKQSDTKPPVQYNVKVNKPSKLKITPDVVKSIENTADDTFTDNDFTMLNVIEKRKENPHYRMTEKEKKANEANKGLLKYMEHNLKTPDDIMKAIEYYESIGDTAMANKHYNFLNKRFPDY